MATGIARVSFIAITGLWLAGCSTSNSFSDFLKLKTGTTASTSQQATDAQASADTGAPQETVESSAPTQAVESTGSVPPPLGVPPAANSALLGSDPNDELSLGKKH